LHSSKPPRVLDQGHLLKKLRIFGITLEKKRGHAAPHPKLKSNQGIIFPFSENRRDYKIKYIQAILDHFNIPENEFWES
jgi:hypothetical protein